MTTSRVLIADDQLDVLEALRLLLKREGYQIEAATSTSAVLEALKSHEFDLLLMDLNYARDTTSEREGLDLLSEIQAIDSTLPVVVMTAWANVELAVEAMHNGVGDFVQKPCENERLLRILRSQIEHGHASRKERLRLREQEREFAESKEIQQGLLPKDIPQTPGYEIAGSWQPAYAVGGDYFDILKFSDHKIGLCIADVAGKGIPATLLMSNLQAAVRARYEQITSDHWPLTT